MTFEPGLAGSLEPAFTIAGTLADSAQIWLIRHGETEWSRSGQHTGRTDIGLTPDGERQARGLRPVLAELKPALVLCSPRSRAQQTAAWAGVRVDAIDPDLAEWDYGDYEGLTSAQIREQDPGWTVWSHTVRGGERPDQVGRRADRVLNRAVASLANGPVLLFSHGHMSRVLGARWVGLATIGGRLLQLSTAATSVLGAEHESPVIAHWNVNHSARLETS